VCGRRSIAAEAVFYVPQVPWSPADPRACQRAQGSPMPVVSLGLAELP